MPVPDQRGERIALAIERIRPALPDLDGRVDVARVTAGRPEDVLVAAARFEAALPAAGAEVQAELALLFLVGGDLERARRHAEMAARPGLGPPEVEARGRAILGRLADRAGEGGRALEHYRAAAALVPTSGRHQLDLAEALVDAGALDEAASVLSVATALSGDTGSVGRVSERLEAAREAQDG